MKSIIEGEERESEKRKNRKEKKGSLGTVQGIVCLLKRNYSWSKNKIKLTHQR